MATFQTQQADNTFLYLKVIVRANSLLYSRTFITIYPGAVIITQSSPQASNGSIPPDKYSWYKLGRTANFVGKQLNIDTLLSHTENIEVTCSLVEDDDINTPFINHSNYHLNDIVNKIARLSIDII
ncbi:ribosomal RNA small subunit methyltransferase G [Chryseobacterium sp. StRB126]|uniref:hypothetical protein n=1 Tax=Chryseobacterium sp. StRB126 TaxID=878220 RepID=UPI0004E99C9F|nr:hypothetical protein [Chryseobacterium sp. StRB126]BAP33306.1 ribosomal RNA small subunit methyltransferase G [Chryseobacterium sp. StRB126]